tara:strand:+ start:2566 stop:4845 length:2280 start_codon:yes stop_codon:yes gene_type:complete
MQNKVQLYIKNDSGNYDRVDLYSNESIELTSKIQDLKDISKVFTDFSKSFNVPASETNNKIFKHFYNFNITNGYDARKKKEALIEINHLPFREGKIFLVGVKMRDNKPFTYNIQFYGKTITIKDLFGDDELSELTYLSNYNHEYSETNIRNGFTTGLNLNNQTESIIYPLITSKKRLYFHSGTPSYNADGNIYHNEAGTPDQDRGLKHTDLKPAIKAIHIIEAIEETYRDSENNKVIQFTRDFFGSTSFENLYMWINSKKGEFDDLEDSEAYLFSHKLSGYVYSSGVDSVLYTFSGSDITIDYIGQQNIFSLDVALSSQTIPYRVIFRNKTTGEEKIDDGLGDYVFEFYATTYQYSGGLGEYTYEIEIQSKSEFTISTAELTINYVLAPASPVDSVYTTTTNQNTTAEIMMENRLPKMKVMDFLTGLFKMFNLTAYFIDDHGDPEYGKLYVDTLDNYYSDAINNKLGGLIDIDKYLDVTDHTVNSVLPFTDVNFKYEETNTVLMENHEQQFNEIFGNAEFNVRRRFPNEIDRGTKYNVKLPFSHLKYERLIDLNTSSAAPTNNTSIQWGYSAGGDFDPNPDATPAEKGDYSSVLIKPLLFYAIKEENLPQANINANANRSGKINWISTTPPTGITSYWRPSNSNEAGTPTVAPEYTINFDNEFDEWQGIDYGFDENNQSISNALYKKFYQKYIEGIFNPAKRLFVVTAYLPPNILVNYRLNDQIRIGDKIFRINSITTNIITGKSKIELLNIFSDEIVV